MHPVLSTALVLAGLLTGSVVTGDDHSYVGSNKCKKCHIKEYRSWEKTPMANVFDLLKPGARSEEKKAAGLDPEKDYTEDEECLPCHTVGYNKKGGFESAKKTPNHLGVGCETCHGPGGTYLEDGYMTMDNKRYKREELVAVGMVGKITAETCTVCHNEDSPFVDETNPFDFEAMIKKGMHEIYPLKYEH